MEHGADVNAKAEGITPLHAAAQEGHSELVNLLLVDSNINVGCVGLKIISKEKADKRKLVQKKFKMTCCLKR
ncbi:ankyrin repeat domain-containing protein [Wolbachia endosymbiont of Cylisticus convexus]|uniref:ankyrin repeat domain-containing protein n=1 Tax=Wolbachia endosymbiont of Cylisticus convexus TaxID=118728 RepID=UPI000DF6D68D|nr:ankyrin repeat domain-containing protein [Wolbachia endosymbiont of Cylisticus convexus]